MTLKKTLDELAKTLGDKVRQTDTSLQESIDAFKALTAYYAVERKQLKKQDEDDPDSGGFSFAGKDEVAHDSRTPQVRTRRNS